MTPTPEQIAPLGSAIKQAAMGERIKQLFYSITGGRPMRKGDCLFLDIVSGKPVYSFQDKFGRYWMAENPYSLFRVRRVIQRNTQ